MDKEKKKARIKKVIEDLGRPAEVARRLNDKDMRKIHGEKHHIVTSYVSTWIWLGQIPKKYLPCLEAMGADLRGIVE